MPTAGKGDSSDSAKNPYLSVGTESYAIVSEVFGLSIQEQMNLDSLTFFRLYRDAFCFKLAQTKEGTEYLEKCWRMRQTKPDIEALRRKFGKTTNE